jgi:hypothetical protein
VTICSGDASKIPQIAIFFLSPRETSGERIEERGLKIKRPSSPRPSPPSDEGEGENHALAIQ